MPEASGLLRQWNLLSGLSTRAAGATVQELALEHGANLKAIRRDLVTLRNAGFPLEEERGDFGRKRWRIAPATALIPMSFTWDEAIALCLARRFLEPLTGTTFWVAAARGFAKIRAVLSPHAVAYLDKMASAIHVTTRGTADKYAAKAEICDLLTEAIEGRQMVDLTYQSENATEAASRTVYPLGFVFHGGSLYLIAHASDHDEQRTYKVDRVEAVHLLKLKFQRPP